MVAVGRGHGHVGVWRNDVRVVAAWEGNMGGTHRATLSHRAPCRPYSPFASVWATTVIPRNAQRLAEPPTETGDVVISAYREYLRVVANCVLAVAGAWGRVLYVGVAGISLLLIV